MYGSIAKRKKNCTKFECFLSIMDATKKPLLIPPEFANYAEKHEIFQTIEVGCAY